MFSHHNSQQQVKDKNLIPLGIYCYGPTNGVRCVCPYWSKREDKPEQESGHCAYLGYGDWEVEGISLLWDKVKQCHENLGEKYELVK